MFCPKCGSLLKPTSEGFVCVCGFKQENKTESLRITEKFDSDDDKIVVRSGEDNPLATEKHIRPKCGCKKAILVGSQIAVRETWNTSETDRPAFICACCGYKDFL
jgi:DNA-directed RNA polymerase subunit M/transcription elongation factor TFIIS